MIDSASFDSLLAQRDAAYWAAVSAQAAWLLGLVTILGNGIGLFLVWRQLRANAIAIGHSAQSAQAAADAAMTAARDVRPWLRLDSPAPIEMHMINADHFQAIVPVRWKNVGRTPASRVSAHAALLREDSIEAAQEALDHLLRDDLGSRTVFPDEEDGLGFGVQLPANSDERKGWPIFVAVRYWLPGSDHFHHTAKIFIVHRGTVSEREISSDGAKIHIWTCSFMESRQVYLAPI